MEAAFLPPSLSRPTEQAGEAELHFEAHLTIFGGTGTEGRWGGGKEKLIAAACEANRLGRAVPI